MTALPDRVKRWLDAGAAVDLHVVDLDRRELVVAVTAEYDDDDLLMAVPEGGPVHHALIYDPQATVVISPRHGQGGGGADLHGEVEMTTAGADELRRRTGGPTADDEAWLVVRVVPTRIDFRG